jgi:hypothetical protein
LIVVDSVFAILVREIFSGKEKFVIEFVDAVMGSGKSTWAIGYINAHPEKKFVVASLFVEEAERFAQACSLEVPEEKPTKGAHFRKLISQAGG